METKENLFLLIKSLRKPEKRFFKVYSGKMESNYIRLFDAFDSMKDYDEKAFKRKFSKEQFINNFAYNKNYLYNLILNSMRDLYADSSTVKKLLNKISHVLFLNSKGLYNQSNKLLDKALKEASRIEHHELMLQLYLLRLGNIISMGRPVNQDAVTDEIFKQQTEILKLISNKYDYNSLHREFFILFKRLGTARSAEDMKKFDLIMKHEFFRDESRALSFDARVKFYHDNVMYSYQKGDLNSAFTSAEKYLQYTESKPDLINENMQHYLVALDNVLTLSRILRNKKVFENTLIKLRKQPLGEFGLTNLLLEELIWSVDGLELERAEKTLKILSADYYSKKIIIDAQDPYFWGYICFTGAMLNIILEKYEESLKWINHIRNLDESQIDTLYSILSKILNLIIHFELKNYDLLESQIKSTYRFLIKSKRVSKFEELFLNYLKAQLKSKSQKDTFELLGLFINDLRKLENDEYEGRVFKSFDLISWLESKIKRKPLIEILKGKVSSASL